MCPENARIFLVEDDKSRQSLVKDAMKTFGHEVVDVASSLKEALDKVSKLDKKRIDVAIVDGNLSENNVSGSDGAAVASAIKAKHPSIIVIGNSLRNPVDNTDLNSPKMDGILKLGETVTNA
jgi:CheY-like chemotaxis protein